MYYCIKYYDNPLYLDMYIIKKFRRDDYGLRHQLLIGMKEPSAVDLLIWE